MIDYKSSGVDVEAGYEAVRLMKQHVRTTFDNNVITDLGSFGGMYSIASLMSPDPILVAGTDGVGTKLKIAFAMEKYDTVGIDCVAMCVNDIVCHGARPLIFLDYIATGKLLPQVVSDIVSGVSAGCNSAGCALIGGETAEMPGFYPVDEFDLAGFSVGIVDRSKVINGSGIKAGDVLVGLTSSGLHSNGFSLVRAIMGDTPDKMNVYSDELGMTIGECLLTPTQIYVKTILELASKYTIKGIANITGGGFIENIPRMIPAGLSIDVDINSFPTPAVFDMLIKRASLEMRSAYNTFNMGIGMVLAVDPTDADGVVAALKAMDQDAYIIGNVISGDEGVILR